MCFFANARAFFRSSSDSDGLKVDDIEADEGVLYPCLQCC